MERPVSFNSAEGDALVGILHTPDDPSPRPRIGIAILNAGLKGRVAPNRMSVKIARMLCGRGFHVLRFDAHGLGDSAGRFGADDDLVMDLWGAVQRGAFVRDTLAANNFFVREAALDKLLLLGQCGGAVTSLMVAGLDRRVGGAILIDLPVRVVSAKLSVTDLWVESNSTDELLRHVLRKVVAPQAWLKLLMAQSNPSAFFRVLWAKALRRTGRKRARAPGEHSVPERFNRPLLEAVDALLARKGALFFVFAERDFSLQEFRTDLLPALTGQHRESGDAWHLHVVKDANHIYTELAWQDDLLGCIERYAGAFRLDRQ